MLGIQDSVQTIKLILLPAGPWKQGSSAKGHSVLSGGISADLFQLCA